MDLAVPKTYLVYLSKISHGNIDKIESYYSPHGGDIRYRIICKSCAELHDWGHQGNFDDPLGIKLEVLEKFCEKHKHEPPPKLSEPVIGNNTLTKEDIEKAVASLKKIDNYYCTDYKPYIYPQNPCATVYKEETVQLAPEQLKKIWQWSDFNVDMQIRVYGGSVNAVRILCSKCKASQELNWHRVNNYSDSIWTAIEKWAREHSYCGTIEESFKTPGRKFKDAN
jgi:hypothetical protein